MSLEEQAIGVSSNSDSETLMSQLDGSSQQSERHGGDAEEAGARRTDTSSSIGDDDATFEPGLADGLDDEELLIGEERDDDDDEDLSTPAPSSPQPVPASKHRAKALREGTESIRPHPTDISKVIITYRYNTPAGTAYIQETEMPEVVPDLASAPNQTGGVIFPDVETSKVPRAKKGSPWMPVPGTSRYEWTRGEGGQQETWRINIFFRRLDRDTHTYQDIYVNTNILKSVDPNDKKFHTSYNKWVLQFARRRDAAYSAKIMRFHRSVAERRALYISINPFCAKFDIHKFGFIDYCKLSTLQLQVMANAVNSVPNPLRLAPRGVDAVRGQIASAHNISPPKNKAIFDLMVKAPALRSRIASDEVVPRAERKPKFAISLSDFGVERPVAARTLLPPGGRKRKRTAAVEVSNAESSSSELSSPPASERGVENSSDTPVRTYR
ncbi:hypothetical protein SVAN01_04750 [Stagonosporopsis vannaccii]|nr:hypothetical protein SVAN01_04750 [Stagonosporopsis vannaccii]